MEFRRTAAADCLNQGNAARRQQIPHTFELLAVIGRTDVLQHADTHGPVICASRGTVVLQFKCRQFRQTFLFGLLTG